MKKKDYKTRQALRMTCECLNEYGKTFNPVMRNETKVILKKYLDDEYVEDLLQGDIHLF